MIVHMVHMHADCRAIVEGRMQVAPKFTIVDSTDDGEQFRLHCAGCNVQLTITVHREDNPPKAFAHAGQECSDAAERPDDPADAELRGRSA